jgi:putative selenate reductase
MSDKLYTYPIAKVLSWILNEEKHDKIFGYYKDLFFKPDNRDPFRISRYNQLLENPLGVASGPQTQMSQNIIISWLFGARYLELKTVQVLDEIEVTKPCIDMKDEGYNCEWSQELKIEESFDEYLNAWILIHLLKDKFGWNSEEHGFIFNISVGYDLKGIKSEKVRWFLNKMKNAGKEIEAKKQLLNKIYPRIKDISIPYQISDNVTLSTMHGCPPDEIEKIIKHLIEEYKFHTAVKLNPTLLGPEKLRKILNDDLEYDITIPDEAFEHDLKFNEAKEIIKRLTEFAKGHQVEFGLKLTNTLESVNAAGFLPPKEKMVYMSGRALHPISINLAASLQNEFNGNLDISFSAGVDAFNFHKVIACGIKPVTVCSDLLKPGGYSRLPQYLKNLRLELDKKNCADIDEFIKHNSLSSVKDAALDNLNKYAEETISSSQYKKIFFKHESIKTKRELTRQDCVNAPCIESCAVEQDVPSYMYYTSKGKFDKAYKSILQENPLPNITGMVCDHLCQTKCTRMNTDNSLLIREIKRFVSDKASGNFEVPKIQADKSKAAIIGAGPSGLSAAYFLRLAGMHVEVFESKSFAGGMVSDAIPLFRIKQDAIFQDIKNIEALGVKFHYSQYIDRKKFNELSKDFDYVYIAVGAQKGKRLNIEGEAYENVYDQLTFLADVLQGKTYNLGNKVAVIGGGNSAMDAARTANRLIGSNGQVTVVYRRTKKEMPADKEEVEALLDEGIELIELAAPEGISKNNSSLNLHCVKVKLMESDTSGRPRPVKISDSDFVLNFDSIITAIGQDLVLDFFPNNNLEINWDTFETDIPNVFAGGDAVRGADSLINAIADGKKAAEVILSRIDGSTLKQKVEFEKTSLKEFQFKIAQRKFGEDPPALPIAERKSFNLVHPLIDDEDAIKEASRCLFCNDICNICVTVCPNIANIYYEIEPFSVDYPIISFNNGKWIVSEKKKISVTQKYQIFNIKDFCNECGNCDTFCPTSGAPYKVKPKFCLTKSSFDKEDNVYYLENDVLLFKRNGSLQKVELKDDYIIYEDVEIKIKFDSGFNPIEAIRLDKSIFTLDTKKIAEMYFYLIHLKSNPLFV